MSKNDSQRKVETKNKPISAPVPQKPAPAQPKPAPAKKTGKK
jgi:hypothetical protein